MNEVSARLLRMQGEIDALKVALSMVVAVFQGDDDGEALMAVAERKAREVFAEDWRTRRPNNVQKEATEETLDNVFIAEPLG